MPINSDLRSSYEAVLHDLEAERGEVHEQVATLQRKLKELDYNIASLNRRVNPNAAPRPIIVLRDPSQKYAHISVRWAILDLLNETGPMATADIADALKAAGMKTKAQNFVNNVSAVLSTTMKGSDEVSTSEGKWELTEVGRSAISHIRMSSKFRRACPWIGAAALAAPGA